MSGSIDPVERGLQMLQDRRRLLGQKAGITPRDRARIAGQTELAREPWSQARRLLVGQPTLVTAIDELWPQVLPHLIKGNEVSPVHHIAYVVNFMVQICLAEVSPMEMKRGVLAALLHDIGIGDCALPKISEASIKRASPEDKLQLRQDGIASRLEHMKLGVVIARGLLQSHQRRHPAALTDDDIAVILDIVGGPNIERNFKAATHDGRIIQLAFALGSKVELNLMPVMLKRLTYTGSTLRTRSPAFKARIAQELEAKVWPLIESGKIKPVVHAAFPLAEAAKAHSLMESGTHIGKIVLTVA